MSIRDEILLKVAADSFVEEVDSYIQAAIHLMIAEGYVNKSTRYRRWQIEHPDDQNHYNGGFKYEDTIETDYYGCRPGVDYLMTRDALNDFIENGIDYAKCSDPCERIGEGFAGTFADCPDEYTYLECLVFSGSGKLYVYTRYRPYDSSKGLAALLSDLNLYREFTIQEVSQDRLDTLKDEYGREINWDWLENNVGH